MIKRLSLEDSQRHLAEYGGELQADAYKAYDALYETGRVKDVIRTVRARLNRHHDGKVRHHSQAYLSEW